MVLYNPNPVKQRENSSENPFLIGLASARANLLPMVLLWLMASVTALSYYFVPGVAQMLEPVRRWQCEYGAVAAFTTQAFFCGVLPAIFLLTVKSIRPKHPWIKVAAQTVWCGSWGIVYLWFYALQSQMFGDGPEISTLVCKMLFDQFVWTPFIVMPLSSSFFLWLGCDFSFQAAVGRCREGFVRKIILPNLVSSWCVWIPAVIAVYAFPVSLQVQMLGFVSSFWALMCLQIGRRVANG
jgi:hypothetical protein